MASANNFEDHNSDFQVGFIYGHVHASFHPPPKTPPNPTSTVPFHRNPDFVCREEILDQIRQRCGALGFFGLHLSASAVSGKKSQVAIECAYRIREKWPDRWVFWIHASNAARFEQSFRDIAECAEIYGRQNPKANIFQLVHHWLHDNKREWMLILDNVDDVSFLVEARSIEMAEIYECFYHIFRKSQTGRFANFVDARLAFTVGATQESNQPSEEYVSDDMRLEDEESFDLGTGPYQDAWENVQNRPSAYDLEIAMPESGWPQNSHGRVFLFIYMFWNYVLLQSYCLVIARAMNASTGSAKYLELKESRNDLRRRHEYYQSTLREMHGNWRFRLGISLPTLAQHQRKRKRFAMRSLLLQLLTWRSFALKTIEKLLEKAAQWYPPLQFCQTDEKGACHAVLRRRPVLTAFYLTGEGWDTFKMFFEEEGTRGLVLMPDDMKECQTTRVRFYDVYWLEDDLSDTERQAYKDRQDEEWRTRTKQYPSLLELEAQCPHCLQNTPIGNFNGSIREAECPCCHKSFAPRSDHLLHALYARGGQHDELFPTTKAH
ncbi:hypothetical protein F5884DRAFT_859817 [Xylogone sp. PMI_703]|nr:hypothetical protein F5884DRAFT_859817 [Xylogone sp. PMI_703]